MRGFCDQHPYVRNFFEQMGTWDGGVSENTDTGKKKKKKKKLFFT
jgi:hypothetical protein